MVPTLINTGNQMHSINALIRTTMSQAPISKSIKQFVSSTHPLWLNK